MDDIIAKIMALRARIPENGASEAEAMTAAEMADKLMRKHGLTEADLKNTKSSDYVFGYHVNRTKVIHPVNKFCIVSIGLFCEVRVWWNKQQGVGVFFGLKQDVELATYLADVIRSASDREYKAFLSSPDRPKLVSNHQLFWSFQQGFCGRINQRIRELREKRQAEIQTSSSTDLVVVKKELIAKEMENRGISLRKTKGRGIKTNGPAMMAGSAAADRTHLGTAIGE